MRLETFLPGITFDERQAISSTGLTAIGELLGAVAAALADFDHPAAWGFMPWDIANGLVARRGAQPRAFRTMPGSSPAAPNPD